MLPAELKQHSGKCRKSVTDLEVDTAGGEKVGSSKKKENCNT